MNQDLARQRGKRHRRVQMRQRVIGHDEECRLLRPERDRRKMFEAAEGLLDDADTHRRVMRWSTSAWTVALGNAQGGETD